MLSVDSDTCLISIKLQVISVKSWSLYRRLRFSGLEICRHQVYWVWVVLHCILNVFILEYMGSF